MCTLGNQGKAFNQKFPKINVNDNILKRFNNNETAGISMGIDNAQLFKVRTCIIQHTYTVVYCRCDKIKYLLVILISQETD